MPTSDPAPMTPNDSAAITATILERMLFNVFIIHHPLGYEMGS
jgi:hypothetical protein